MTEEKIEAKMPKGMAMLVRSILGVDPAELTKQFNDAFQLIVGFCKHADARLVSISHQLDALTKEVATLTAERKNVIDAGTGRPVEDGASPASQTYRNGASDQ